MGGGNQVVLPSFLFISSQPPSLDAEYPHTLKKRRWQACRACCRWSRGGVFSGVAAVAAGLSCLWLSSSGVQPKSPMGTLFSILTSPLLSIGGIIIPNASFFFFVTIYLFFFNSSPDINRFMKISKASAPPHNFDWPIFPLFLVSLLPSLFIWLDTSPRKRRQVIERVVSELLCVCVYEHQRRGQQLCAQV